VTTNQAWLLRAAKQAATFFDRKARGVQMRGLYEDLEVGRNLFAAIAAVEADEQLQASCTHQAAKISPFGPITECPTCYARIEADERRTA
jgi:hypothetical protein